MTCATIISPYDLRQFFSRMTLLYIYDVHTQLGMYHRTNIVLPLLPFSNCACHRQVDVLIHIWSQGCSISTKKWYTVQVDYTIIFQTTTPQYFLHNLYNYSQACEKEKVPTSGYNPKVVNIPLARLIPTQTLKLSTFIGIHVMFFTLILGDTGECLPTPPQPYLT